MWKRINWKKPFFVGLMLCIFSADAKRDPFSRANRSNQPDTQMETPVNMEPKIKCPQATSVIASEVSFQHLKLIGLIQYKDRQQAIFSDVDKHIFSVGQDDWIAQESYQIKKISSNEVQMAKPKNRECHDVTVFSVPL